MNIVMVFPRFCIFSSVFLFAAYTNFTQGSPTANWPVLVRLTSSARWILESESCHFFEVFVGIVTSVALLSVLIYRHPAFALAKKLIIYRNSPNSDLLHLSSDFNSENCFFFQLTDEVHWRTSTSSHFLPVLLLLLIFLGQLSQL